MNLTNSYPISNSSLIPVSFKLIIFSLIQLNIICIN